MPIPLGESSLLRRSMAVGLLGGCLLLGTAGATAWADGGIDKDAKLVVAAVDGYHRALTSGDSLAAIGLLADDAMVLESGHLETLEEYVSHHLAADMSFSAEVPGQRKVVQVVVVRDAAWVVSTSTAEGKFRDRTINSVGAELMVLSRVDGDWKIRAIHWSSHNRRSE